jgi:hypothetical protein
MLRVSCGLLSPGFLMWPEHCSILMLTAVQKGHTLKGTVIFPVYLLKCNAICFSRL